MGNKSTWRRIKECITPGLCILGTLTFSWVLLASSPEVKPPTAARLEAFSVPPASTPEITVYGTPRPEVIPAAPGGVAVTSAVRAGLAGHGRSPLLVYCSASSFRLVAAPLEQAFETEQPDLDLVLHIDTDRNCVGHLLMGTADVAMIGSKLSSTEQDAGLRSQVLGHRIIVPIVHKDNPVNSVNYDDFCSMLNGRMTGWSSVGGRHLRIEPVCMTAPRRRDLAADAMRFGSQIAGSTAFMQSHPEILGYVANNPRALGLVSQTSSDRVQTVKVLRIDQIAPSLKLYQQGAWHLGNTFQAVHAKDPYDSVQAWLEFLRSDAAITLIQRVMTLPE